MNRLRILALVLGMLAVTLVITLWLPPSPLAPAEPTQAPTALREATPAPTQPATAQATPAAAATAEGALPEPAALIALYVILLGASLSLTRGAQARWAGVITSFWLIAVLWLFGLPGLIIALTSAAAMFILMVGTMRGTYKGNLWAAIVDQWRLLRGVAEATETVEDGRSTMKEKSSPLAPRTVVIKPYNAVVFEEGSKQTRICGPAKLVGVKHSEKIKRIYDLRPRQDSWSFPHVLTEDLIPTTVIATVTYRIDVSPSAAQGLTSFGPADRQAIQHLDLHMPDWQRGARGVVEKSVRAVLGTLTLDDLVPLRNAHALEREINRLANISMQPWGLWLDQVILESVRPLEQVTSAATDRYIVQAKTDAVVTLERDRAQGWADALSIVAGGYNTAKGLGMPDSLMELEGFRRTLEHIAKEIRLLTEQTR